MTVKIYHCAVYISSLLVSAISFMPFLYQYSNAPPPPPPPASALPHSSHAALVVVVSLDGQSI